MQENFYWGHRTDRMGDWAYSLFCSHLLAAGKERPGRGGSVTRLRACASPPSNVDLALPDPEPALANLPPTTLTRRPHTSTHQPDLTPWLFRHTSIHRIHHRNPIEGTFPVKFSSFLLVTQFCNWVSFTLYVWTCGSLSLSKQTIFLLFD